MTFPNFLIIGANKGGTSSFYQYLSQHPEIFMSDIKEPMFFMFNDMNGHELADTLHDKEPQWDHWRPVSNLEEYKSMFRVAPEIKAAGEASTTYLANPVCAERIAKYNPEMKIIAILRNPVRRAFSNYLMYVRLGVEKESFRFCVEQEMAGQREHLPQGRHYIALGYYGKPLKQYLDVFGKENVRVYLNEELRDKPEWLFRDAFEFLGVDTSFRPDVQEKFNVNENVTLRSGWKNFLMRVDRRIPFISMFGSGARRWVKGELILDAGMKNKLNALYRPDIELLAKITNRNLDHWLK